MFMRFGKWLVVLALVLSTGGHWVALQSVAWVRMAITFAQTEPLHVALKKTFDGKHPCQICKTVQEGRKSDQKQATLKVETKLEFCLYSRSVPLPLPAVEKHLTTFEAALQFRSETPPTPPPRSA